MHHPDEHTSSFVEGLERLIAHVPRAGYVVGATGRVHAVNTLAGCSPQDVDPGVRRALIEALKPSSQDGAFKVVASFDWPSPLFVIVGASDPDPLERALPAIARRFQLTPAEASVLRLWMRGLTQAQIAAERGTEAGTVHIQLKHIRGKLGVSRRREMETFLRGLVGL
jgi:DNA-binding CsgD family transcriptional regulator